LLLKATDLPHDKPAIYDRPAIDLPHDKPPIYDRPANIRQHPGTG